MLNRQTILIAVLVVAAALGASFFLSNRESPDSLITTETIAGSSSTEKELVTTLLALRAVTLDGAIFNETSFLILSDSSSPILPEPVGRPNPFAPLSGSATSSSSETIRAFGPVGR
jgi:hypothetical protein